MSPQEKLNEIEKLHHQTCEINGDRGCPNPDQCQVQMCGPCGEPWPCPTMRIILD